MAINGDSTKKHAGRGLVKSGIMFASGTSNDTVTDCSLSILIGYSMLFLLWLPRILWWFPSMACRTRIVSIENKNHPVAKDSNWLVTRAQSYGRCWKLEENPAKSSQVFHHFPCYNRLKWPQLGSIHREISLTTEYSRVESKTRGCKLQTRKTGSRFIKIDTSMVILTLITATAKTALPLSSLIPGVREHVRCHSF